MAATGGGKIRSRRYHTASKPYAKSKQQQPGLISRVTDTVKSIVPSWLQKYFRNGEAAEGGGAAPGEGQNNQAPPPNGSEEVAPPHDGRDSPEPSTSNTEPSTSRVSLNFQDHVLSRPPLNRSHLHFPSLDTSTALGSQGSSGAALFSQPSTSAHAHPPFPGSAFATGTASSSGFSLVKEIKDTSSQHEDDNISTTSGFSSRASEKDVPTSKTASLPQLWSPETDRTHSGPQPAQSSLKRPAFNLSVFGTSSTSTMNSSGLNSSQLGDSPFYPGKTTYGGAASVRTARSRPATPYQAPMRRQMKAKPAGAQPCGVTSATARRILQSLERMSSPLADAKRIPSAASPHLSTSPYGTILERSHLPAKRKRDSPLPPVQKLVIPSAASSAGNRSMSFRASLTPAGLGRPLTPAGLGRPLTPREQPARQSPGVADVVAGPSESTSSLPYPLSTSTPAASGTGSGGGKMKRDRTSTRQPNKRPDDDVVEVLDLPAISLPISTFSLPTFSFSSPPPAAPVTSTVTPMATELVTTSKDSPTSPPGPCVPFTFASPIVMTTTAASPPSFSPTAGFTFSAPVAKTGPSVSNGKMATPTLAGAKSSASEEPEEFEGLFKPAKVLKQGSVLDLLKTPGFASPARSSPDPAPVVSTAPSSSSSSSSGFGDLFKPPAGSWSCDICMVQNKPADAKCVACQSPQPNTDSSSTTSDCKPPATTASRLETTTTTTTTTPIGFGTLFSTPAGTWDCDTCLVQNKPEAVKCVACQTLKPGTGVKLAPPTNTLSSTTTTSTPASSGFAGFGDKFKKSEGAWECDTCMVENSAQDSKCVACMSAKPGAASASLAPPPTSSTPLLGFGDKFKKPEGSWECDVCCVQNKAADLQCVACQTTKPGAKVEPKASSFGVSSNSGSGGFKFGTSSSLSDSTSGTGGFKFGATAPDSALSASSGGFKFGVSSSSGELKFGGGLAETPFNDTGFKFGVASSTTTASDDDKKAEPPTVGVGFKFGAADTPSSTESKPSEGGFSFGLTKPEATTTTSFPSSFSVPAASQEKTGKDSGSSVDSTSTTTATTTAASLFGSGAEPARTTAAPLGGATFGAAVAASAEKELPAPSFTFGKPEEKEPSVTSGFLFGAAGKEAEGTSAPSVGFSFSKPDPPKEPAQPSFSFGKRERERGPSPKSETPAEAPKASFSFGQSATDAAAPVFGFMASSSSSSTTSSSSSTTPAPSLFGTPSSTTTAPSTTFLFGQGSSSDAPPAKSFLFGQNQLQDSQPAPLAAPTLNAAPVAPAPAQPFLFGSAVTTAAPAAQSSFAFGAAAPSAASSTAPPPSVGPSPFVFSSASSTGFGSGQAPTFGQVSSQPSAPAFGSPAPSPFMAAASQPPAFGATSVFGTPANSTSGGGFQFGGAGAFGAANSSAGVFSFGGAQAGSPAPSATPSITPQPSAPGGGFNFAQPPAFNMGSAKNNFTASPAGQNTIAGRKIKTAVRRRK